MDGLILGCREAVERVGATIHDIQTSSRRMVDVTGVVDTVAFQANLLAVDAVITAAGGDRERAFSALAAQVHGLGQRSADAAREIKTLIEDTLALIHASGAGTSQAQAAVTGLTEDLRQITAFITDITYSAEEQAAGITQISQALGEMEQITQRNAALVVQTSAAAGALAGEAATLDTLVRAFRTGALTPPDAAAPPRR